MAIFVIMQPPGDAARDQAEPVRDRFSFLGFFLQPFWLLWRGLWIEAVVTGLAWIGILALIGHEYPGLGLALWLILGLFVALEGPSLQIAALRRAGWREGPPLAAGSRDDALARWVAGTRQEPIVEPQPAVAPPVRTGIPAPSPALGLLDYPGRR